MQRKLNSHRRQQGATLIVALVMLVLIMMAGIAAVTSSSTQFKLAGNLQFEDTAMNTAEAAVAVAENWLQAGTNFQNGGFTTYAAAATPHLHPIGRLAGLTAPANDPLTMTWSNTSSLQVAGDHQRYMIEQLSTNSSLLGSDAGSGEQSTSVSKRVNTYMVTARAQAPRGATKFVQSYFSVLVP